MAKSSSTVFSGSKKSLGIAQGVSWLFPQVLSTEKETSRERKRTIAAVKETEKPQHCIVKRPKLTNDVSLETKAYPEFMFRHKFSLLVVGPTQCGKTFFVEKILTTDRILYESKKPRRIWWYYSQWQDTYKVMQSSIGKEIQFFRGLPEFKEDLREIDPKFNNVLVFDDLMAQATDSPLVSLLFTQGRHRNASVILLLQNMFPKGKFNTDISRNAQYVALSEVLAIESKSVSWLNECLTKIASDSCQLIFKKRKECLVISSLTIAQTRRVITKY